MKADNRQLDRLFPEKTLPPPGKWSHSSLTTLCALLVFVGLFLALTMPRWIYEGDAVSVRVASGRLLTTGHISVPADFVRSFGYGERGEYYCEHPVTGKWYSKYGVFNTLLYLPPLLAEQAATGRVPIFQQLDDEGVAQRRFLLNAYNIVLSLVLAGFLYYTALIYVDKPRAAAGFVIVTFFGTFLWYFLRAQTVEIFQVLFFTAGYFHLMRADRHAARNGKGPTRQFFVHALLASLFAGLLCLQKLAFVLLAPPTVVFILLAGYRSVDGCGLREFLVARIRNIGKPLLAVAILPIAVALGLAGLANAYCFGSPFASGYHQWERYNALFSGDIGSGLYGFLFGPRKSILLYFPVFTLSLLAALPFARRHRFDAAFAWIAFAIFYPFCSALIFWNGDWCYGPRYLLFVLPVLSLPCLELVRRCSGHRVRRWLPAVATTLLLLWVGGKQVFVHGGGFFAPFRAERPFESVDDPQVRDYFRKPFWTIDYDLLRYRAGKASFPALELSRPHLSAEEVNAAEQELRNIPLGNFYWLGWLARTANAEVATARMDR